MPRTRPLFALLLLVAAPVAAAPTVSAGEQASLSMTLYQQGFALVRDERTVELPVGRSRLAVTDISEAIVPESLLVTGQGVNLHSAEYARASLTRRSLLEYHVGKTVRVVHREPSTGKTREETGVLLSVADGIPIVRIGKRIEIGGADAGWTLAFDTVPDELHGRPGLTLDLDNSTRGPQSLSLVYLSRELSWRADYVGVLEDDDTLRFSGWVSLRNGTDTAYRGAQVQLLAGDVHRPDEVRPLMMARPAAETKQADMSRSAVGDYHLYTLPEPVDLLPAQQRQVRLLAPRAVPVRREYRIEGDAYDQVAEPRPVPVAVRLRLRNDGPTLGVPLPGGLVRIYSGGQDSLQYLGEDRIDHTPAQAELELRVGTAFDVTGERTTTEFRRVDDRTTELAQRIVLKNQKTEPVVVTVVERLPGEGAVLNSERPFERPSAQLAEWRVEVPAGGEASVSYRARITF